MVNFKQIKKFKKLNARCRSSGT